MLELNTDKKNLRRKKKSNRNLKFIRKISF